MAESRQETKFPQVRCSIELKDQAEQWIRDNNMVTARNQPDWSNMIRKAVNQLIGLEPTKVENQPDIPLLQSQLGEKDEQIRQLYDQLDRSATERENLIKLLGVEKAHVAHLSQPLWKRWFGKQPLLPQPE